MPKRVIILGSTGSIGKSALDVIRRHSGRFEVVGLAAHSNVELLSEQIREFRPSYAAVVDESSARRLDGMNPGVRILRGPRGIEDLAGIRVDIVLCAIVGAVGLKPILRVIEAGSALALANKEPLVMAGALITRQARSRSVPIIPVDSEHSAIAQCLHGYGTDSVHRVYLTASGGPFYGRDRDLLARVTPDEAAKHPTWDMGRKISVDSATLMNKGLEIIEAMWLFDMPIDKIQVLIHPQSVVHGLVEFTDGSIIAQLGPTDMKFPIELALTWPERAGSAIGRLDLTRMGELTFAEPDFSEFPCLGYAIDAAKRGGAAAAVLNAANETAVEAFCQGRIRFLDIASVVCQTLETCPISNEVTLESVLQADQDARRIAGIGIGKMANSI